MGNSLKFVVILEKFQLAGWEIKTVLCADWLYNLVWL